MEYSFERAREVSDALLQATRDVEFRATPEARARLRRASMEQMDIDDAFHDLLHRVVRGPYAQHSLAS
jgi:hypothetical protein